MKRTTVAVLCIAAVGIMSAVKITEEKVPQKQENKEREKTDETAASVGVVYEINQIHEDVFTRIQGISYPADAAISTEELRYLKVPYYGFDGQTHEGELIVNQRIAEDTVAVFKELYEAGYPIEQMKLIDDYQADDERSMSSNNTSAFNYRTIAGSDKLSNHGKGLAIDINPLYNPCVQEKEGEMICEPAAGKAYADRMGDFSYKIEKGDLCYRIFEKYGFSWGGDWDSPKDYQHFEKTEVTSLEK